MESPIRSRLGLWPSIAQRADQIADPIAKLRYLQQEASRRAEQKPRRRALTGRLVSALLMLAALSFFGVRAMVRVEPLPHPAPRIQSPTLAGERLPDVWQVDAGRDAEVYSNGLRIENQYRTANHPRSYRLFPVEHPKEAGAERHRQPVGIVFHTTESEQQPFESAHNRALKQVGESLLEFVRHRRSYHFLIDRFGRVFRIVQESDAAEHAGYSVWSDREWLYVNLNESFLGVSFEARTEPGQEQATISPAQVRVAAMLVEMLRSRYHIDAANCVTHAQVSVNPSNMRVGFHTDWASSFPFAAVGLPDNYAQPLPALLSFGFEADADYRKQGGPRLSAAVDAAEASIAERAAESELSPTAYRRQLQRLYREHFHHEREAVTSPESPSPPLLGNIHPPPGR